MTLNPIMIAPFKTGLETDTEPWLAPPDSFSEIDNIHVHHGYIQKREGFRLFGTTVLTPITIDAITNALLGEVTTNVNHNFTNGDIVVFSGVEGMIGVNDIRFTVTVTGATTFTFGVNTTDYAAYTTGGSISNLTLYRVMGITRYIGQLGIQTTIAFNARNAYRFNSPTNAFIQLDAGVEIFSSGEYDFVWSANWQSGGGINRLYFTNGKAGTPIGAATVDGIRYYDGITDNTVTVKFNPRLSPATLTRRTLDGAKLIFSLGQRLIVLHTYEYDNTGAGTTTTHPQRARWSAKQNPANWDDVIAGGGGYTDAATGDYIISARQIQNQIIVFFTNSVWALIPTSDPNRAFKWQKINSFRSCDGKMASIGYDRYAKALGIRGITATDGVETRRIDEGISEFTVDDINVGEFNKVFCERSYANNRWWTLFNAKETPDNENDSALIFDDDSGAFTTYEIAMNCLGYGNLSQDYGLNDFVAANNLDLALNDFGDEDCLSYFWQENQEIFLGGDINGNVFVMETGGDDNGEDMSAEFITAAWNPYKDQGIEAQLNYIDFYVDTYRKTKALISFYKDTEVSPYLSKVMDFLPNLDYIVDIIDATATNPVNINAANHGLTIGDTIYIYGAEGMIDINSGEASFAYEITVVDANNFTLDDIDGSLFDTYTGGGRVYNKKFYRTKTWKRVYAGGIGFQHKIGFYSGGVDRPFRIHAFKPAFKQRGKRVVN